MKFFGIGLQINGYVSQNIDVPHTEPTLDDVMGSDCSDRSFSSLAEVVSDKTLKAVSEMGFTEMMEIQSKSIRPLLQGR